MGGPGTTSNPGLVPAGTRPFRSGPAPASLRAHLSPGVSWRSSRPWSSLSQGADVVPFLLGYVDDEQKACGICPGRMRPRCVNRSHSSPPPAHGGVRVSTPASRSKATRTSLVLEAFDDEETTRPRHPGSLSPRCGGGGFRASQCRADRCPQLYANGKTSCRLTPPRGAPMTLFSRGVTPAVPGVVPRNRLGACTPTTERAQSGHRVARHFGCTVTSVPSVAVDGST